MSKSDFELRPNRAICIGDGFARMKGGVRRKKKRKKRMPTPEERARRKRLDQLNGSAWR